MKISNLLKKLNTKLPKDRNKEIVFLNILRSKKYYKDFFAYSKSEKFYEFFEYSALKNKKEFFSYVNKLIKTEKNNFKNRT